MIEKKHGDRPCVYLEGTTQLQCLLYLARMTEIPSEVKPGNSGTLHTPQGPAYHANFWFCKPALKWLQAKAEESSVDIDTLIADQNSCSHYDTEMNIPLAKRWIKPRR